MTSHHQKGVALFVTLVMVTVMLLILATISYRHQLDFRRSSQVLITDQVVLLALSGESWIKKLLADDDNDFDSLEDDWAQSIPALPVEGGWLTGCVMDLQGRFNLNNLGAYQQESFQNDLTSLNSSVADTYLNLLAILELDAFDERAAVIVDWIDADDELVYIGSAEDQDYSIGRTPRMAANAPIVSVSELVTIKGYSAADLSMLRPYITALPNRTEVNVNTASPTVLLALLPGLDQYIVDAIVENRPFEDQDFFYELVSDQTGSMTVEETRQQLPQGLIGVTTDYFELNARVSLAGMDMGLTSILYRRPDGEVMTLQRTFEYLPRIELMEGQTDPLALPCFQGEEMPPQESLGGL
ncbi:MAG: type II secretion system minor pseudopilin GspK [Pseudomonadales bacterium]